jgi:molybdenum cofactor cytidylyltransferase
MGNRGAVVGVLLAAGVGTRFEGGNKLLAQVDRRSGEDGFTERRPIVQLAATRLVEAPVEDAVAVLGHQASRVREALGSVAIHTVVNPDYTSGQASSVARGVDWARERDADAALFALGDMPWIRPSTYRTIVGRWEESDAKIVVPVSDGTRGNPVLFDATYFDALSGVSGDVGGRALIARNPVERVAVEDPAIHRDVDREGDIGEGSGR